MADLVFNEETGYYEYVEDQDFTEEQSQAAQYNRAGMTPDALQQYKAQVGAVGAALGPEQKPFAYNPLTNPGGALLEVGKVLGNTGAAVVTDVLDIGAAAVDLVRASNGEMPWREVGRDSDNPWTVGRRQIFTPETAVGAGVGKLLRYASFFAPGGMLKLAGGAARLPLGAAAGLGRATGIAGAFRYATGGSRGLSAAGRALRNAPELKPVLDMVMGFGRGAARPIRAVRDFGKTTAFTDRAGDIAKAAAAKGDDLAYRALGRVAGNGEQRMAIAMERLLAEGPNAKFAERWLRSTNILFGQLVGKKSLPLPQKIRTLGDLVVRDAFASFMIAGEGDADEDLSLLADGLGALAGIEALGPIAAGAAGIESWMLPDYQESALAAKAKLALGAGIEGLFMGVAIDAARLAWMARGFRRAGLTEQKEILRAVTKPYAFRDIASEALETVGTRNRWTTKQLRETIEAARGNYEGQRAALRAQRRMATEAAQQAVRADGGSVRPTVAESEVVEQWRQGRRPSQAYSQWLEGQPVPPRPGERVRPPSSPAPEPRFNYEGPPPPPDETAAYQQWLRRNRPGDIEAPRILSSEEVAASPAQQRLAEMETGIPGAPATRREEPGVRFQGRPDDRAAYERWLVENRAADIELARGLSDEEVAASPVQQYLGGMPEPPVPMVSREAVRSAYEADLRDFLAQGQDLTEDQFTGFIEELDGDMLSIIPQTRGDMVKWVTGFNAKVNKIGLMHPVDAKQQNKIVRAALEEKWGSIDADEFLPSLNEARARELDLQEAITVEAKVVDDSREVQKLLAQGEEAKPQQAADVVDPAVQDAENRVAGARNQIEDQVRGTELDPTLRQGPTQEEQLRQELQPRRPLSELPAPQRLARMQELATDLQTGRINDSNVEQLYEEIPELRTWEEAEERIRQEMFAEGDKWRPKPREAVNSEGGFQGRVTSRGLAQDLDILSDAGRKELERRVKEATGLAEYPGPVEVTEGTIKQLRKVAKELGIPTRNRKKADLQAAIEQALEGARNAPPPLSESVQSMAESGVRMGQRAAEAPEGSLTRRFGEMGSRMAMEDAARFGELDAELTELRLGRRLNEVAPEGTPQVRQAPPPPLDEFKPLPMDPPPTLTDEVSFQVRFGMREREALNDVLLITGSKTKVVGSGVEFGSETWGKMLDVLEELGEDDKWARSAAGKIRRAMEENVERIRDAADRARLSKAADNDLAGTLHCDLEP